MSCSKFYYVRSNKVFQQLDIHIRLLMPKQFELGVLNIDLRLELKPNLSESVLFSHFVVFICQRLHRNLLVLKGVK